MAISTMESLSGKSREQEQTQLSSAQEQNPMKYVTPNMSETGELHVISLLLIKSNVDKMLKKKKKKHIHTTGGLWTTA